MHGSSLISIGDLSLDVLWWPSFLTSVLPSIASFLLFFLLPFMVFLPFSSSLIPFFTSLPSLPPCFSFLSSFLSFGRPCRKQDTYYVAGAELRYELESYSGDIFHSTETRTYPSRCMVHARPARLGLRVTSHIVSALRGNLLRKLGSMQQGSKHATNHRC